MQFTIKSRRLGAVTFSRSVTGYIYADLNGEPGTLGRQICRGGRLIGCTLEYSGDDIREFKRICRAWINARYRAI